DSWDSLSKHLLSCGYRADEIIAANLGMNNRFGSLTDRFRNRVMFPIIDLQGSVIAFGGRTMEKDHGGKKYLNTSDTLVYKKTNNLYGLNWAKNTKGDTIVVTEGFMDVIAMWQAGIENVVASQGTAFTSEQARLISRYAKRVVLAQDGDEAGQNAIRRSIPTLRATGIDVRVLAIPDNLDPDEYIKKYGVDRMRSLLDGCESDIDYTIGRIRSKYNLASDDGRLQFLREVCPALSELSAIEREVYAGRIAADLGIDKGAILSQIDSGRKRRQMEESRTQLKTMEAGISGREDKTNPERREHIKAARAEESLLVMLYRSPDMAAKVREKLPPEKMVTSFNKRLYSTLLAQIDDGQQPSLTMMSQSLTPAEMGAAARIFNSMPAVRLDPAEADGYIDVIIEEGGRPSSDSIADASAEDLKKYLETLRKKKK
ncbi:MAG: toprim domain-containing protein, partial [Clostridia bacterium]|nr:toprim domain-containing protein [Clostridia bacterium]